MNEPPNASFVYSTSMQNTSIRLLRFSRQRDGTFKGTLKAFPLDSAPPFYSASYVWGPQTYSSTIHIGSGPLPVLSSVVPFLEMVDASEDFDSKDWWWIDSICINLSDRKERGAQVKIMGDIYQRARRVIVWLGPTVSGSTDDGDCTGAIEWLNVLFISRMELDPKGTSEERARLHAQRVCISEYAWKWEAVRRLLSRQWWTRVWTLQEYLLPAKVMFYCGEESIKRGELRAALYGMYLVRELLGNVADELIERVAFGSAWNRRRVLQWYQEVGSMNLVALLAYLGNHEATDARDRIYSILGLVSPRDKRVAGDPDYSSSIEQIFSGLVRRFWHEYKSLDILCFVTLFNRDAANIAPEDRQGTLPSWAPDWRAYVQSSPVPLMASQPSSDNRGIGNFRPLHARTWEAGYDAPGTGLQSRSKVRFHDNGKEFWADGVVLGTINVLGGLNRVETRCTSMSCEERGSHQKMQAHITNRKPNILTRITPVDVLASVVRCLVLDRKDKYLRFQAPNHFVSDFLELCRAYCDGKPVDPIFKAWLNENEELNIDGRTLMSVIKDVFLGSGSTLSSAPPLPLIQQGSQAPPADVAVAVAAIDDDSFLGRFHDTVSKKSRRLMMMEGSSMGMVPCRARIGDYVAVLSACSIPLVLRRVGSREAWIVIGEAYVDEWMNGEVQNLMGSVEERARTFRLV